MCITHYKLGLILLLAIAGTVHAQAEPTPADTAPKQDSRARRETIRFTERSPLSSMADVIERFRTDPRQMPEDYELSNESFELYVPADYDGSESYGLLVWINAGDSGAPPAHFLPVLEQHKLIWIGANRSGNPRSFWHRAGLALDGLHNATLEFNIDPMRIYVSGISGGGRSASRVGLVYADQFAGALSIVGTDYFKRLPHPDSKRNAVQQELVFYAPAFNPPSPEVLRRAKRDGRYVLLTGEHDQNRDQTLITYKFGYQRAQFANVTYLEVPGMGHELPPAEWFAKGIDALDAPLVEVRQRRETEAGKAYDEALYRLRKSPKYGVLALRSLLEHFGDTSYAPKARAKLAEAEATAPESSVEEPDPKQEDLTDRNREDLALAKNYLDAGRADLAKPILKNLIERAPDSEQAQEARGLLKDIGAE